MRIELFEATDVQVGEVREVKAGQRSLAVLRKRDGSFRALRNRCSHQGAPLARGICRPMIVSEYPGVYEVSEDREVLLCPWHGYEFDVDTGRCPADPLKMRVARYRVEVEEGKVVLYADGHGLPPRAVEH
jgi:nitrite reductase (NADH) small subunit